MYIWMCGVCIHSHTVNTTPACLSLSRFPSFISLNRLTEEILASLLAEREGEVAALLAQAQAFEA